MDYQVDTTDATYLDYKSIRWWWTDCKSYANERNDCAVAALALAVGIPYGLSHAIWEKFGREYGGYAYGWNWFIRWSPFKWKPVAIRPRKIRTFIRNYPKGNYIVITRAKSKRYCHAFNIIDGEVWNPSPFDTPDSLVCLAWKIVGLKKHVT